MIDDPGVPEWRHGWHAYRGAGCDWGQWVLEFGIGFWWHQSVGIHLHVGPLWAYVSLEEEDRLFVDGVDQGVAMAPVEGYRE